MEKKIREIVAYKHYFEEFLLAQPKKVQEKIYKVLEYVETQQRIPEQYLKQIEGSKGLYETRVKLGSDIWRVFCFFDRGKLIILLNGFQKKTNKTPQNEIEKAEKLMKEYFDENRKGK